MKTVLKLAVIAVLLVTNLYAGSSALAHNWGSWHWNRGGSSVTIQAYNTATYRSEASAAINDWSTRTILYVPQVGSHTDLSVFDGNYGATGWGGIAEIINYSGSHITHGHARLNYYYSYSSNGKRGVFCQEVGHLFGLTHSNDGGCMGFGYWYGETGSFYTIVQHNIDDIYNKYRFYTPH